MRVGRSAAPGHGSVTGIVIATLASFVVNGLLPLGATFAGYDRAVLEIWTFYLMWLVTFGHVWLRPGWAWIEQCWSIACLAVASVLLNWITTGDHLMRSFSHRHLWPVAGWTYSCSQALSSRRY